MSKRSSSVYRPALKVLLAFNLLWIWPGSVAWALPSSQEIVRLDPAELQSESITALPQIRFADSVQPSFGIELLGTSLPDLSSDFALLAASQETLPGQMDSTFLFGSAGILLMSIGGCLVLFSPILLFAGILNSSSGSVGGMNPAVQGGEYMMLSIQVGSGMFILGLLFLLGNILYNVTKPRESNMIVKFTPLRF